jgi:membrane-associated phospholipid phosphatase
MAAVALPRRWRPLAAIVAGLVGVARIVHGVHLPADVVGGWSFGVLISLATLAVGDAARRPRDESHDAARQAAARDGTA